jgi:hypothetical protein
VQEQMPQISKPDFKTSQVTNLEGQTSGIYAKIAKQTTKKDEVAVAEHSRRDYLLQQPID